MWHSFKDNPPPEGRESLYVLAEYASDYGPKYGIISWEKDYHGKGKGGYMSWCILTETKKAVRWQYINPVGLELRD